MFEYVFLINICPNGCYYCYTKQRTLEEPLVLRQQLVFPWCFLCRSPSWYGLRDSHYLAGTIWLLCLDPDPYPLPHLSHRERYYLPATTHSPCSDPMGALPGSLGSLSGILTLPSGVLLLPT